MPSNLILENPPPQATTLPRPAPRYTELDSLRGLAALTVVLYHFRRMWLPGAPISPLGKLARRFVVDPLTGGPQAVVLFFILSGFVLSVPYLRGKGERYFIFVARRILRIYAPYLVALALAVAGAARWHGTLGHSAWIDMTWQKPVTASLILQHILFIGNYDWEQYNTAFWSLVFEMRLSLVFPFIFALVLWLRSWIAVVASLVLLCGSTMLIDRYLAYEKTLQTASVLAFFIVGILLAKNLDVVQKVYDQVSRATILAFSVFSLAAYLFNDRLDRLLPSAWGVGFVLQALGATGFIILAIQCAPLRGLLHTRMPRFLGRISYSLYLLHGTVLFALAASLSSRVPLYVHFVLYLTVAFCLSTLFCVFIEEPFMRLSRRLSKWLAPQTT